MDVEAAHSHPADGGVPPRAQDDPRRFTTHVFTLAGVTILGLCGDLDLATRDRASIALEATLTGGPEMLVLDLRALDVMDATGVLFLLGARTRSESAGVRMVLLDGSGDAHRAILRAGARDAFEVVGVPGPGEGAHPSA